jgi:hypothetical protein
MLSDCTDVQSGSYARDHNRQIGSGFDQKRPFSQGVAEMTTSTVAVALFSLLATLFFTANKIWKSPRSGGACQMRQTITIK